MKNKFIVVFMLVVAVSFFCGEVNAKSGNVDAKPKIAESKPIKVKQTVQMIVIELQGLREEVGTLRDEIKKLQEVDMWQNYLCGIIGAFISAFITLAAMFSIDNRSAGRWKNQAILELHSKNWIKLRSNLNSSITRIKNSIRYIESSEGLKVIKNSDLPSKFSIEEMFLMCAKDAEEANFICSELEVVWDCKILENKEVSAILENISYFYNNLSLVSSLNDKITIDSDYLVRYPTFANCKNQINDQINNDNFIKFLKELDEKVKIKEGINLFSFIKGMKKEK
jgi:hypothetical protein